MVPRFYKQSKFEKKLKNDKNMNIPKIESKHGNLVFLYNSIKFE